jgi:hypothetical protein
MSVPLSEITQCVGYWRVSSRLVSSSRGLVFAWSRGLVDPVLAVSGDTMCLRVTAALALTSAVYLASHVARC